METNYVLLVGFFLLLLAVDCSSSDPKGDVNGKAGIDQNVDSKVDPVKEHVDSKSVSDSIGVSIVKDNEGGQINVSGGGIDGDASKSNFNQQSGSNEGVNLKKDGKELSAEAKGKMDGGKDGTNVRDSREESNVEDNGRTDGGKDGANVQNGIEASNFDDKVKTDGKEEGANVHNGREESNVDDKGKMEGGEEGAKVHNGQGDSNVDDNGKTDGGEKGANVHNGREESNVGDKGKTDGGEDAANVHNGRGESNVDDKGKTGGGEDGANVHNGREELNVGDKRKTDGGEDGANVHNGQGESNVDDKGKMDGGEDGANVHNGRDESNVGDKGKKDGGEDGEDGANVHNGREESNVGDKGKMYGGKDGVNVHNGREEANVDDKGKTDGGKKENPDGSVDPKQVTNKKDNIQDSIPSPPPPPPPQPTRNDGFRGEECDSSNMCMDENKRFAACLRVPGNESPELSLLIQNKGKGPLTLKISAPAFVQLEEADVELQEKQEKEVKVSIKNSGTDNLIVLKDGSGECSLDFKEFIMHNSAESYVNFLSQTPTTAFIFVVAILMLASGWMCMSFRRRQLTRRGLKYQRLDMELPVSSGANTQKDVNDGWNNSWGDNWDDEEALVTPSMPVTPSLSSKGLASRRLSKEGWKD